MSRHDARTAARTSRVSRLYDFPLVSYLFSRSLEINNPAPPCRIITTFSVQLSHSLVIRVSNDVVRSKYLDDAWSHYSFVTNRVLTLPSTLAILTALLTHCWLIVAYDSSCLSHAIIIALVKYFCGVKQSEIRVKYILNLISSNYKTSISSQVFTFVHQLLIN